MQPEVNILDIFKEKAEKYVESESVKTKRELSEREKKALELKKWEKQLT